MLTGRPANALLRLTAPMMLGVSSSIVVQTLEMGFIGQLSTQHVAAITFTFPLTMILTSIALGISIGTSSVIARSVGADSGEDFRALGTHSLLLIAISMSMLAIVGWLLIDPIFTALGANREMLVLIHSYLDIYYPGTVLFTLTMIASSIMRANGVAGIPGTVMALGAGLNLAIDPFLIFGWFGLPRMELAGAATAMTITRVITTGVLLYYVISLNFVVIQKVWSGFVQSTKRILHIGIPAMATQLIGPVTAALITSLLASHGEIVVAGFGVATRLEALAVMLFFALSGSIGPFVGQNYGAKKPDRVAAGLRVSYQFCMSWGLVMAVCLFLFGDFFAQLIDDNAQVVKIAAFYLMLVPWSYGAWGVLMMASASFNALGKPIPSTVMSFIRMFVLYLPLAWGFNLMWGYEGIFAATMLSNLVMGGIAYVWFKSMMISRVAATTR